MTDDFAMLKAALADVDARLARQGAMAMDARRSAGVARLQWGLWPLWFGQGLQMLAGLALIALAMPVWSALRDGGALFFSAVIVHAYGVLCLVLGGAVLGQLARIDRSDSLLATQTRIARLQRFYIRCGMAIGLPWWLLWIPFAATVFHRLAGVDLYANLGGATLMVLVATGIAGLAGTAMFHRWIRQRTPGSAATVDRALMGRSLAGAQARLDALSRFAQDD